jgi:hypothetical protein
MSSAKLNMRLNAKDEQKIAVLKERYGFTQTSELIRFLLTTFEHLQLESKVVLPVSSLPSSKVTPSTYFFLERLFLQPMQVSAPLALDVV